MKYPKVERLVVVAAPSCCGKSTLLEKLSAGEATPVSSFLKIDHKKNWIFVDSDRLGEVHATQIPHLLLHYALPAIPLKTGALPNLPSDPPLKIIENAQSIVFVTLYADPKILVGRVRKRKRSRRINRVPVLRAAIGCLSHSTWLRHRFSLLKKVRRWNSLETVFADVDEVEALYAQWFNFIHCYGSENHRLVCTDKDYAVHTLAEWHDIVQQWH
mgnify:CR=1 FL=1